MKAAGDRPTLDDYHWLITAEAGQWLTLLHQSNEPLHRWAQRLRREFSAGRTHLLLEQTELRRRAQEKFCAADQLFFTRMAMEQSTDQWLAAYKAERLANAKQIADLCCGIGGDLLALARNNLNLAVDRDAVAVALAEANVRSILGLSAATKIRFEQSEVHAGHVREFSAWHIDPDRRPNGCRTSQPEASAPARQEIEQLLAENPNAAIKLAPAAKVTKDWAAACELEWLGRAGECKQLVAWHGGLARRPGERRATVIGPPQHGGSELFALWGSIVGTGDEPFATVSEPMCYVYEPHAAVLAARLQGALARQHDVAALTPKGAYLTGDHPIVDGTLACFEVCDELPFDRKQLHRYFAERGIGSLEIKSRNLATSPEQLRRELKLHGDLAATLIIVRDESRLRAIVARRCAVADCTGGVVQ